jgi:hypothetical protein
MAVFEFLFGIGLVGLFLTLSYIGIHMSFEKEKKENIPLIWEPGGLLYNLFKKEPKKFDKSDIKYRDGDNT